MALACPLRRGATLENTSNCATSIACRSVYARWPSPKSRYFRPGRGRAAVAREATIDGVLSAPHAVIRRVELRGGDRSPWGAYSGQPIAA